MLPWNSIGTRVYNVYWNSTKLLRKKKKNQTYSNNGITLLLTVYNYVILHIIIKKLWHFYLSLLNIAAVTIQSYQLLLLTSLSVRMQFCPSLLHPQTSNLPVTEPDGESRGLSLGVVTLIPLGLGLQEQLAVDVCTPAIRKCNLLCDFTPYHPFSAVSTHTFSLLLFPFFCPVSSEIYYMLLVIFSPLILILFHM